MQMYFYFFPSKEHKIINIVVVDFHVRSSCGFHQMVELWGEEKKTGGRIFILHTGMFILTFIEPLRFCEEAGRGAFASLRVTALARTLLPMAYCNLRLSYPWACACTKKALMRQWRRRCRLVSSFVYRGAPLHNAIVSSTITQVFPVAQTHEASRARMRVGIRQRPNIAHNSAYIFCLNLVVTVSLYLTLLQIDKVVKKIR